MGTLCKKRFLLKRDNISSRIRKNRSIGIIGCAATFSLFALFAFILSPLYLIPPTTEATTKDPTPSSLTYTAIKSDAVLPLDITSASGSFATTYDHISFTLTTTNATGYTLNIKTSGNNTALVDETNNDSNTNSISSISSTITREVFSDANNTTYNNKWGIHPSSYYQDNTTHNNTNAATSDNPIYFPASNTGFTMDSTTTSNAEVNRYFVGLGVRADYTVPAGTYTNTTLIAEYVANPVTYAIHYYTNTTDTVTNMPTTNPQTGTVSSPTSSTGSIITTIASTPTRTGYTFLGWCMGSSAGTQNTTNNSTISNITNNATTKVDSCSSTVYDAGQSFGIDTTNTNPDTYYLYAMWSVNSYTCTKQYRLQNADGSWGNYTADGTEQIKYGETCNYSKTVTNYKNAANGTNNSTATTSGIMNNTNGITLSLDLYRNTFTCKISYRYQAVDGTYGSATVAVNTTKRYGEACSWSTANISNFDSTTYKAANYTNNSITANVDTTVNIDRNTFTVTKRYRLQGTDGTYPTTYTSGGTETVRYGASTTYSIAATTSHQAASKSSGTVTAATTISLDVPRKVVTCNRQYRLENADGTWGSYTSDGTTSAYYGGSCSYSKTVTNYRGSSSAANGAAGSASASNVTSTQTLSISFYRNTFTCLIKYQLQNADGTYATAVNGTNSTLRYGQTCSWSRSADATYKAASYSTTITANVNQTVSVDRNTFTVTKRYRLQETDGTYPSSYTAGGTETVRYGSSTTYSIAATTTHQAASKSSGTVTANTTISLDVPRKVVTCNTRYRLQNADGTWGSYTSDTATSAYYGGTCSYSKTMTDYKGSSSGANGSAGTVSETDVTSTKTLSLSFYRNTYALTVNRNTTYISSVTGAGTYRWGQSVSISATPASNSAFNGWTVSSGSTGTFAAAANASTTYTMPKGASTIYANGKFKLGECEDDPESCMQTMTTCSTTAKTVTDARDGNTYMVRQLLDGNCWMLDNLALDLTDATIVNGLNANNTNASNTTLGYLRNGGGVETDKYPMTGLSLSDWTQDTYSYSAPLVNTVYKDNTSHPNDTFANANTWKFGVYYNYCAVSAGSYCYGNGKTAKPGSGNATEDICPKGWRMPTGDTTSGEFWLLYDTYYSHNYTNMRSALRLPTSAYIVQGELYNSYGREGRWWTASRSDSDAMWFYSLSTGTNAFGDSTTYRYYGNAVRCILK